MYITYTNFRVWDLFLLLGDSILLAMAYNILKLHSKTLIKMDMDSIGEFFQKTLPSSFGYEDGEKMNNFNGLTNVDSYIFRLCDRKFTRKC